MSDDPHPALREISPEEWNESAKKLLAYTIRLFSRYFGSPDVILVGGNSITYSAADVAQEVVLRVLEGDRRWDPEQHDDFAMYLIRQVRGIITNNIKSSPAKHESYIPEDDDFTVADYVDKIMLDEETIDRSHLDSPEQIMLDKDLAIEKKELSDLVMEAAIGDPELEALVEAYLDSDKNYQRRYIAEKLETTPDDVTNRWKRLSGRAKKLFRVKTQRKESESV